MLQKKRLTVFARFAAIIALCSVVIGLFSNELRAQGMPIPFGGAMPNVGAMSYDLVVTRQWSPMGMRMTGYASSRGGIIRWVHCLQSQFQPNRKCRLMVNGRVSENFTLSAKRDLHQWLSSRLGLGSSYGYSYDGMPTGSMGTSGKWRWGTWIASGHFRYWR